jgi:hypothetical protein
MMGLAAARAARTPVTARTGLNCMVGDDIDKARAEFKFNGTLGFSLYK